jgi:hypothetical protein
MDALETRPNGDWSHYAHVSVVPARHWILMESDI